MRGLITRAVLLSGLVALPALAADQPKPVGQSTVAGVTIQLAMSPTPVKAMTELRFVVTVREKGAPVSGAKVSLDLTMVDMFMGVNRPLLKESQAGVYVGTGILPRCHAGGTSWQAKVLVEPPGGPVSAVFRLPE